MCVEGYSGGFLKGRLTYRGDTSLPLEIASLDRRPLCMYYILVGRRNYKHPFCYYTLDKGNKAY